MILTDHASRWQLTINSKVFSTENRSVLTDLAYTWCALLVDSHKVHDVCIPTRSVRRFLRRFMEDPLGIIRHMSVTGDLFFKELGTGSTLMSDELYALAKATPIFKEIHMAMRDRDPRVKQYALSVLYWGKKAPYKDSNFNETALRSWFEVEEKISGYTAYDEALPQVMSFLLKQPKFGTPFEGHHGSGQVSEGTKSKSFKWTQLGSNLHVQRVYHDSMVVKPTMSDSVKEVLLRDNQLSPHYKSKANGMRIARIMFVPKNYKTSRTIAMEPAELMFYQQDLRHRLEKAIKKSCLGRFVTIDDQSHNRDMALYGSWSRSVDTIDLSAASDSLSTRLVRHVFKNHRPLLKFLLATRSTTVELPNGSTIDPVKFAPMGSALCFPTQSVVYSCLVTLAYLKVMRRELEDDSLSLGRMMNLIGEQGCSLINPQIFEPFRVYGDDIICDSRVTEELILLLRECGFTVNTVKSFIGSSLSRESCGIYANEGEDITPIVFKVKYDFMAGSPSPATVVSSLELANRLLDLEFYNTRKYLCHKYLKWIPYKTKESNAFGISVDREVEELDNSHLESRYNTDLQRSEVRCRRVGIRGEDDSLLPDVGLADWFLSSYRRGLEPPERATRVILGEGDVGRDKLATRSYRRPDLRFQWGWTPIGY